ncbi:MAG TPA: hypothetical protein VG965_04495 [Patescibacteria group bacterium]|nr:hypothetical protein [Patescibacteria group bacterium]
MAERLYGVEHGVSTASWISSDKLVAPSRELMMDLFSLPPGTKVGIESAPEFAQPIDVNGNSIDISQTNQFYWHRIQRMCERRGLQVEYLEDFPTYRKYLEKLFELKPLREDLINELRSGGVPEKVMQQMHKVEVEAKYIFLFEREEKIFDRIQETQPQVVIIGRGHTDPLLLDPTPITSRNIEIGVQKTEEIFLPPWDTGRSYERASIALRQQPDEEVLLTRELTLRNYRAVTEGRVMEGVTPDYIGSWDTQVPARGLFEIYMDENGMTGVIEDCLGTAKFSGFIDDEVAFFTKKYDPKKSSKLAVQGNVAYNARKSPIREGFLGDFMAEGVEPGMFRIKKFDGNPYPVEF